MTNVTPQATDTSQRRNRTLSLVRRTTSSLLLSNEDTETVSQNWDAYQKDLVSNFSDDSNNSDWDEQKDENEGNTWGCPRCTFEEALGYTTRCSACGTEHESDWNSASSSGSSSDSDASFNEPSDYVNAEGKLRVGPAHSVLRKIVGDYGDVTLFWDFLERTGLGTKQRIDSCLIDLICRDERTSVSPPQQKIFKHTLLSWTVMRNQEALVRALVAKGADVNAFNANGWTPLMYAGVESKNTVIIDFLMQHGADPSLVSMGKYFGMTVCEISFAKHGPSELHQYLDMTEKLLPSSNDTLDPISRKRTGYMPLTLRSNVVRLIHEAHAVEQILRSNYATAKTVDESNQFVREYRSRSNDLRRIEHELTCIFGNEAERCLDENYLQELLTFRDGSKQNARFRCAGEMYKEAGQSARDAEILRACDANTSPQTWSDQFEQLHHLIDPFENRTDAQPITNIIDAFPLVVVTQNHLKEFIHEFAQNPWPNRTEGIKEGGCKSLYRVWEKIAFKKWLRDLKKPDIWDLCRALVSYRYLGDVKDAFVKLTSDEYKDIIEVVSIHSKLSDEVNRKWQDLTVHVVFKAFAPEDQLVCEIQFCVWKYTSERKNRGGHGAYSAFRSAQEILSYFETVEDELRVATESKQEEEKGLDEDDDTVLELITLVASDGEECIVERDYASCSELVRTTLESDESEKTIPLSCVNGPILRKVVEYATYHHGNPAKEIEKPLKSSNMREVVSQWDATFIEVDQETLFEIILAANYMVIPPLLDLSCAKVASMIKGKSPEEVRGVFGIQNDFTPEEEAAVRAENKWAEDS